MLTNRILAPLLTAFLVLSAGQIAGAQEVAAPAKDPTVVCARVDDVAIRYADIERERKRRIDVKSIGEAEQQILDSRIREQLIERHLAMAALMRMGKAASGEDIDFELARWKEELKLQGMTFTAYLAKEQMSEADFKRDILWRISWNRYLSEYLTEANLEKFFKDHQADYDGRKLRVAQILLKLSTSATPSDRKTAIDKANSIRNEITSGKQNFAAAAKSHSQAASAVQGGDQGWIERREPMGEEFSKAAFALSVGETSPPVATSFGIHLIHCLEIEPGKKTWRDARRQLERDVTAYLGRWLASQQKDKSHVERTDALPAINVESASPAEDNKQK